MTREEAIMELKIFSGTTRIRFSANFWEALNTAIKALEQEPCEDAVSRKELMETYNSVETPVGYRKVVDMEVIKNMPSVTPTTCIAKVTFSKDDLQELVDKKVEELAQTIQAIPLDKVKEARRELDKLPIYGAKFTDDFRIHLDREEVFSILDKLIAESEEV